MQRADNLHVIAKAVALGLLVAAVVIPIFNNIEEKDTAVDASEIRQDTAAVPLPEAVAATEIPPAMAPVAISTPEITTAQPAATVKISDEELEAAKRKALKICDAKKAEFANYIKTTDSMTYDVASCKILYLEQVIINSIYIEIIAEMPPMNSDELTSNWIKIYRECDETFKWMKQHLDNSGLPSYRKSVPITDDPEFVKIQKDIEVICREVTENSRKAFTGELWQK